MRTLNGFLTLGSKRLLWFVFPICLLWFTQAFSNPAVDFLNPPGIPVPKPVCLAASPLAVTVTASSNAPLCAGTTLNLNAQVSAGTAPFTFSWSGPGGFTSATQNPSRQNVTTAQAGNYTVTVTDATGMSGTATTAVEINTAPTANAGADKILCKGAPYQLNGSVGGSATSGNWTASVGGGTFLPNPAALNAVYNPPANFEGVVTLTLTTNDPNGPCTPASDQMTITYDQPEALVCNDLVEISMDDDCQVTVTPDMALEGDVLDSLFTVNIFTLQGQNIGNTITSQYVGIPLKIKVIDNCSGNFCITDCLVRDVLPPVFITCESFTVPCVVTDYSPDFLYYNLGIAAAHPQVTDNCSAYTLTKADNWVDIPCGGSFNGQTNLSGYVKRVWTATDASGNKSTCTQYIYFSRVSIQDLTMPADVTVSCDVMATDPMATGTPYYTAFGHQFPLNGNNTFCEINASHTDQTIPFCGGTYSVIRTWTVYDLCSPSSPTQPMNPLNYTQLINVIDEDGPAIACPANMTVTTDPLTCCATVNLPDVVVADACGKVADASALILVLNPFTGDTINQIALTANLADFAGNNPNSSDTLAVFGNTPCLPVGKHIVYYYGEDACGNSSYCSFTLTIVDNVPPVAACDEITQVSLGIDGMIFVNAATFDDGSYDNCGLVFFKVRRADANGCQPSNRYYDQVKFCCEDVGDTVDVFLRVYDTPVPAGEVSLTLEEQHSNDCMVQVYIDDKLKPVCVPPNNVTVSCENFDPSLWAYGAPTTADNCCVDTTTVTDSYMQFDTVCSKGTIMRTFRVFDCHGLSNQCTQKIYVEYKQDFYVRFPDDVVVTVCAGVDQFGEPKFYGKDCELLGVSYTDQVFTVVPDACFKIERTWTIINWCTYNPNLGCTYVPNPNPSNTLNHPSNLAGPVVSAFGAQPPWAPSVTKINPSDTAPTNFSTFWSANVNCYQYKQIIKITDTQKPTIQCPPSPQEVCDISLNDPTLWNETYWLDKKLLAHDLCEAPADLCVSATDACSGSNVNIRYLLYLDLDNNGTMETVVSSQNPPGAGVVNYNNVNSPNYSGGLIRVFDERNVPANEKYQFAVQTSVSGFTKTACLRWNTAAQPGNYSLPQLPYGTHKIKWIVEDGCGNEEICEYTFVVKDCKPPTIKCLNGISTNMMLVGQVMLDYHLFLQEASDNCTPKNMLIFGIRKAGTGNGFPYNPDGTPQTMVAFDCSELGFQLVELWAMDMSGNADYCTTFVHIQDNIGACSGNNTGASATVAGMLQTEMGGGLEEASVQIQCLAPTGQVPLSLFDKSDIDGHYKFNNAIPILCSYTLTPLKDNDPLNGVSTFDLVLINKHILGLQPFASPYKIIAADANNSRTVTTYDIVELRKLILGIYTELPDNTSWRFVDKAYQFPDAANPFKEAFPETKSVSNLQTNHMDDDFVAVKIGDVNSNNIPNGLVSSGDRSAGTLLFDVAPSNGRTAVKPGDLITIDFTAAEKVLAYQFTLSFPDLDVVDIQPGEGLRDDNFALFADDHLLTTSCEIPDNVENAGFRITFRARAAGQLNRMLGVSSRVTKAEAYRITGTDGENAIDEQLDVALRFNQDGVFTIAPVGFELYQNTPNPWVRKTQIGFHLPEASEAILTVYDEMGRMLFNETADYNKGYNSIFIEHALLDAPGVMYYTLETPFGKVTRKMVQSQ